MAKSYRLPPVSNGCEIHHDCLTCPLEMCVFEMPGGITGYKKGQQKEIKYAAIRELRSEGGTISKVAEELGISMRSVCRAGKQAGAG